MKKELAKYLSAFQGIDLTYSNKPEDPDYEVDESQLKKVLDEIFSVDPVSGFPKGDIHYYMSTNGNPQVKQWLENNLLKPRLKKSGSSLKDVTDDMIVEMSRYQGETVDDYASRLMSIYDTAKAESEKPQE